MKISIITATYNSAATVRDTIESVLKQEYKDYEYLVIDGGSKDDTVEICRQWLERHSDRFIQTKQITTTINTGVPSNLNRGIRDCSGDWIKPFAGDDMLMPDAIDNYVNIVNNDIDVVVGLSQQFYKEGGDYIFNQIISPNSAMDFFFEGDATFQYKMFHRVSFVIGPCFFIRKTVFDKIGLYDERYPYFEDIPFIYKLLRAKMKMYKLNKVCVLYRINQKSLTHGNKHNFYNIGLEECSFRFRQENVNKDIKWWDIIYWQSWWIRRIQYHTIVHLANNRINKFTIYISILFNKLNLGKYRQNITFWYYNRKC